MEPRYHLSNQRKRTGQNHPAAVRNVHNIAAQDLSHFPFPVICRSAKRISVIHRWLPLD